MTIDVTCSCGKSLAASDEWAGRRVKCPRCGAVVAVSAATPPPASNLLAQDDDWAAEFASSLDTRAPRSPSPYTEELAATKPRGWWYRWLFWKFPSIGSKFTWNEPTWFRLRLRDDMARRVIVVLAVGAGGAGAVLTLLALISQAPSILDMLMAIAVGAIMCGLIAWSFLFRLRDHVSGSMRLKKDGIQRNRSHFFGHCVEARNNSARRWLRDMEEWRAIPEGASRE